MPSRNGTGAVVQPFAYLRIASSANPTGTPSAVSAMNPQASPLPSISSTSAACSSNDSSGQSAARISAHTAWSAALISLVVTLMATASYHPASQGGGKGHGRTESRRGGGAPSPLPERRQGNDRPVRRSVPAAGAALHGHPVRS